MELVRISYEILNNNLQKYLKFSELDYDKLDFELLEILTNVFDYI